MAEHVKFQYKSAKVIIDLKFEKVWETKSVSHKVNKYYTMAVKFVGFFENFELFKQENLPLCELNKQEGQIKWKNKQNVWHHHIGKLHIYSEI